MAFTKIVGAGIHTLSNVHTHNINSSGIITATNFVGIFSGTNGDFSGDVTIDGNLTVNGTTTTLDTNLTEVDKVEVAANNSTVGVAITQSGSGDILRLYDGSSQVLSVSDGGDILIGQNTSSVAIGAAMKTLSMGGQYLNVNGTTPKLSLWHDGTDHMGFGASGNQLDYIVTSTAFDHVFYGGNSGTTEFLRIKGNSGNVGIGTEIPTGRLEVSHPTSTDLLTLKRTTGNSGIFKVIIGGADPGTIFDTTGISNDFIFRPGGTERVRMTSLGKLLVGTATAGFANYGDTLTVENSNHVGLTLRTASDKDSAIYFADSSSGGGRYAGAINYGHGDDYMNFTVNQVERLRIGSTGISTFYGDVTLEAAGANRISMRHTSGGNAVIKNPTAANLSFGTNNQDNELTIANGGKVGINEASPDSLLHITADSGQAQVRLQRSGAASNGNDYGRIYFESTSTLVGQISVARQSAENDGYMIFKTATGGTLAEKLRITSTGKIGVNYASSPSNETIHIQEPSGASVAGVTISHLSGGNRYGARLQSISGANRGIILSTLMNSSYDQAFRIDNNRSFYFYNGAAAWNRIVRDNASHYTGIAIQESNATQRMQFGVAGTSNDIITNSAQHDVCLKAYDANLLFATNTTERLRIHSDGIVTVGDHNGRAYGGQLVVSTQTGGILTLADTGSGERLQVRGGGGATSLGSISNHDLIVHTNGTSNERLRITSGGSLGIANASPVFRVDIGDGTNGNDPASGYQFRINAYGDYIFALAKQSNASFSIRNNSTSVVHLNTQNSKRLALGVSTGSNSGSIEEHVTIKAGGNMGVGTNNPVAKLVVSKSNGEGIEFVPGNRTDENDVYHYDRGSNLYCSYRTYATKHEFWQGGSSQGVEVTPQGNLKIYHGARIRLATSNESDDSWVNIQSDNHYNTIFGLNLQLNYSGNSGTHQVKQRNTHGTIGSAGMFIGGNGSSNNTNITFFRNAQGSSANTVFAQDSWKFQIGSALRQNFNLEYLQRGYFKNDTNNSNATNFPLAASGISGYAWGYQEAYGTTNGAWTHPYPDLVIGYHTGISFGGNTSYGGCRFFQDHPSGNQTLLFSVGNGNQNVHVTNTFTAGTKTFRIVHPHPSKKYTHDLVHSVIEGPQCDNIYRGKVDLVDGTATVNIDTVSNMTNGTFVLLNRDVQCFTSNETGWTAVKGSVTENILTIIAQDNTCTDTISWMVVGERQDDKIKSVDTTDENGKLIMEPLTIEQTHM